MVRVAEEIGMRAEFSADYKSFQNAINNLVDGLYEFGKQMGLTDKQIDRLDKKLNDAASSLGSTGRAAKDAAASERGFTSALQEQIEKIRQANQATRALADSRKQLRSNLDTNLGFIPQNGPSPRVGSSFGNIVDQDDKRNQQASRSYLNLSTSIDQAIDSRKKESSEFARSIQARMQAQVETEKATAAQEKMNRSILESEGGLARTRYALYDVATTYAAVAAATLAAASAGAVFATRYETAFTEIERTTLQANGQVSSNIEGLREQFLDLSEVIPITYEELTKIGSLGAQLGIAEQDLVEFTETVAQFARVSGVSAEESALAFGRIGELLNVPATEYRNLGSAIAYVATESAATDAQIISLTKELAAGAAGAGFTAAEVVGLGGALASLGVAPERARGALDTYFGTLNKAVAEGGEKLENFALITGLTSEKLAELVATGKGEEVLQRFIQGLNQIDNIGITQALDDLGLSQLRVENTFRRLGQNAEFVAENLRNAEGAYASGSFLGDAFAVVLDDVASQFQLVQNSIGRFLATAGQPMLEFLRVALPITADFLNGLTEFASTPFGQNLSAVATAGLVLVGVMTALRAGIALATASTYALITAQNLATGSGIRGALAALVGGFGAVTGATLTWRNALLGVATATGVLLIIAVALDVILMKGQMLRSVLGEELGGAVYDVMRAMNGWAIVIDMVNTGGAETARIFSQAIDIFGGLFDVISGAAGFFSDLANNILGGVEAAAAFMPALGGVRDVIVAVAEAAIAAADAISGLFNTANRSNLKSSTAAIRVGGSRYQKRAENPNVYNDRNSAFELDRAQKETDQFAASLGKVDKAAIGALGSPGGGGGSVPQGAKASAKELRTLVDYANDLAGVFNRAFDIRFGTQLAVDGIADQWDALGDRIRQARMEIQGLTAERNVKEYFLSVADAYGDELRAGKLRSEIADINQKIADTQENASTQLNGNSKAARQNRKTLTDLAKGYENYIVQLAESGADQETLNAAVAKSEREFRAQALALGFSNQQIQPYIQSFRGLTTIINGVPRNITVSANINPALQALNEFAAKAYQAGRNGAAGFGKGFAAGGGVGVGAPNAAGFYQSGLNAGKSFRDGFVTYINREGGISFFDPKTGTKSPNSLKAYSTGGYTGRGGKYEPAGIVHKGEYVVPKSQVNQGTGLPYSDAMGGLKSGSRPTGSYAGGGLVGGGSMMVSLSPQDRALLRSMGASGDIVVAVNDREIARASASGSKKITQEGGRL